MHLRHQRFAARRRDLADKVGTGISTVRRVENAEQFLKPSTAHQVRDLLAIDNETTLAQASTWADEIRPRRPETARWHYVNIPVNR